MLMIRLGMVMIEGAIMMDDGDGDGDGDRDGGDGEDDDDDDIDVMLMLTTMMMIVDIQNTVDHDSKRIKSRVCE